MSQKISYSCDLCGGEYTTRREDFAHFYVKLCRALDDPAEDYSRVYFDICNKCLKKPIKELLTSTSGKSV